MTPTPCRVAGYIISIGPTYSCARVLTYLHSWLCEYNYKTSNISETVEDKAQEAQLFAGMADRTAQTICANAVAHSFSNANIQGQMGQG